MTSRGEIHEEFLILIQIRTKRVTGLDYINNESTVFLTGRIQHHPQRQPHLLNGKYCGVCSLFILRKAILSVTNQKTFQKTILTFFKQNHKINGNTLL